MKPAKSYDENRMNQAAFLIELVRNYLGDFSVARNKREFLVYASGPIPDEINESLRVLKVEVMCLLTVE